MRRAVVSLLLGTAAIAAARRAAEASPVTIHVGAYTGRYFVAANGGPLTGPYTGDVTLDLAANTYTIDTGAGIGSSAFAFSVDASGNVANVSPEVSATASGSLLTFNTVSITINAGSYTGRYFLSNFGTALTFRGNASVVVVPGLAYTLDDGAEIAFSSFAFSVDASANIVVSSPAATATGSTLSLVTVPVTIYPQAFAGTYFVSSQEPTAFSGTQTFNLMPGLAYSFDNTAHDAASSFVFQLDAAGSVSTASSSAMASGSSLTLANVFITFNPSCYSGTYVVTGYPAQQGTVTLPMIPGLDADVQTTSGIAQFTPQIGSVPIALQCFSLFGSATPVSPYTALIQAPIKSDGSSVFNASRGVVPVKFTLTFNGASTCQLPAATISLMRTSGSATGVVNQDDYLQPSDNGASFRIDSTACQYVYNLGTSALGAGTYVVQISINGTVVGQGRFGLK